MTRTQTAAAGRTEPAPAIVRPTNKKWIGLILAIAIGLAILGSVGVAAHQKAGTSLKGWSASPTGAPQSSLNPSPTPNAAPTP